MLCYVICSVLLGVWSCCTYLNTTANKGDTTSNLVGLTMLGVVGRVRSQIDLDAQLLSIVFLPGVMKTGLANIL